MNLLLKDQKRSYLICMHVPKHYATIDVFVSLAILASEKGYVCPEFSIQITSVNMVEG